MLPCLILLNYLFRHLHFKTLILPTRINGGSWKKPVSSSIYDSPYCSYFYAGARFDNKCFTLVICDGRDSILPKKLFGYVHPKYKTPILNILFASIVSLLAIFISVNDAIRFVNFGALNAFFFVNLCVISL